ncbi:aldo/keto reductase [Labedella populi]|uniref:Aldo/keto reductase n=1 Tax=Labedella populi TaxID=2498850 RepID=A0A3S4CEH9_9MICO|nr:aldo/keto reductase [Labedella populi]RWZ68061.1 aldo/keto reductase [Labedella populi]
MHAPPAAPAHPTFGMPQLGLGVFDMDDETTARIVSTAIELGYRSIDTASVYGNERGVGEGIRRSGIDRGELFVTTKLWIDAHDEVAAVRACEQSLDRLGLERVDLYLVHWPYSAGGRHRDAWRGLEAAKRADLTRHIGVSNFSPTQLDDLVALGGEVPVVNQIELHPFHTRTAEQATHRALGIVTESWSPLARGRVFRDPGLQRIAVKHGVTVAQAVLRWHVQSGFVTVPKSAVPERLAENLDVFEFALDPEDMALIEELDRGEHIEPDYYRLA